MKFYAFNFLLLAISLASAELTERVSNFKLSEVGVGWDYLKADTKSQLFQLTYNQQLKTNDGKYLIPDCMNSENIQRTSFQNKAEVISTFSSFKSLTAKSISMSASGAFKKFSFSGSYSREYERIKNQQRSSNTVTVTTSFNVHGYTLRVEPTCKLTQSFVSAINDINDLIIENTEQSKAFAKYISQYLVKEYGSHYVTKAKYGGTIWMEDYLSQTYWDSQESQKEKIEASASFGFSSIISFKGAGSQTTSVDTFSSYNSSVRSSFVDALGGNYKPGMTALDWSNTLDGSLSVIDREANTIGELLNNQDFFPSLSLLARLRIKSYLDDALNVYLEKNAKQGCMNRRKVPYDQFANYEEGNLCEEAILFGGTYAESLYCLKWDGNGNCIQGAFPCTENNIITTAKSCPSGYSAQQLVETSNNPWLDLFVCTSNNVKDAQSRVLFGGMYSFDSINPVTGSKRCPSNFRAVSLIDCSKNMICLSTELDKEIPNSAEFGGFISSCRSASQDCPLGYEKYFLSNFENCKLYYCAKVKSTEMPQLSEPPFVSIPTGYESRARAYLKN
jgi:hypothetical protein